MGFWYFLLLFVGISLLGAALLKSPSKRIRKWSIASIGVCMIAFSIFMFQDGSAEIVDDLLKSFNINI